VSETSPDALRQRQDLLYVRIYVLLATVTGSTEGGGGRDKGGDKKNIRGNEFFAVFLHCQL
jgi:hypothetical protein